MPTRRPLHREWRKGERPLACPPPLTQPGFRFWKLPQRVQQQRNRRIGHLVVQHIGRIRDHNALRGGMPDVDTVIADAEIGDDFNIGEGIHPGGIEAAGNRYAAYKRRRLSIHFRVLASVERNNVETTP